MINSLVSMTILAAISFVNLQAQLREDGHQWKVLRPIQSKAIAFKGDNSLYFLTIKGDLWLTIDGGKNWEHVSNDTVRSFEKLTFIDVNHGWAVDNRYQVWFTIDSGHTWDMIASLTHKGSDGLWILQIRFLDQLHGWILGQSSIWWTEDGGLTWQEQDPLAKQPAMELLAGFYYINDQVGWIGAYNGVLYHTKNRGRTWELNKIDVEGKSVFNILYFIDERFGWIGSTSSNKLYRTVDGGGTWQLTSVNTGDEKVSIASMCFLSKDKGWVSGMLLEKDSSAIKKGAVLYTADGGRVWKSVRVSDDEVFYGGVYFSDDKNGWAISTDKIYRTEDGGQTWRIVLKITQQVS
jgi:photosystem II stability/assembly factor-like uncharacterized protein